MHALQCKKQISYGLKETTPQMMIKIKQVVKAIRCKKHCHRTWYGSIIFARLCQCASHLVHSNQDPHCSSAANVESIWAYQLLNTSRHVLGRPLSPSKLFLQAWGSEPHLIHGSFGPLKTKSQTASRSVQPFLQAHGCDRQTNTDRQTDRQTTLFRL